MRGESTWRIAICRLAQPDTRLCHSGGQLPARSLQESVRACAIRARSRAAHCSRALDRYEPARSPCQIIFQRAVRHAACRSWYSRSRNHRPKRAPSRRWCGPDASPRPSWSRLFCRTRWLGRGDSRLPVLTPHSGRYVRLRRATARDLQYLLASVPLDRTADGRSLPQADSTARASTPPGSAARRRQKRSGR